MQFREMFQQYKWYLIPAIILSVSTILLLSAILLSRTQKQDRLTPGERPSPTHLPTQAPFRVLSTTPENNAVDVYAGELLVTVTTDTPIITESSLALVFTPPLTGFTRFENTFPTTEVKIRLLGGLQPQTSYTASLMNAEGIQIHTWRFTTSTNRGQGQSGLRMKLDEDLNRDYYPLIKALPFRGSGYVVSYTDRLRLRITLTRSDLNRDGVLREVKTWVQTQGVDPESHAYVFAEDF